MKFFADEGLDFPLVAALREKGFTVIYAAENYFSFTDETLLEIAFKEDCLFITKDKDFGELVIRNQLSTKGIILIRVDKLNVPENCIRIVSIIEKYNAELPGAFTVIQEDKIRIRKINYGNNLSQ
jgi:predicted nuclease of predicted toxin-antitoxin system